VARYLRQHGFAAAALAGGYRAWRAKHPVESKPTSVSRSV
jgi:rhodanese-related sulfurtransferase